MTITTDTLVIASDTSLENQDVTVDGATLTIDGPHVLSTLNVINGGVVTHTLGGAGVDITATTITIDASSSIDVTGKGSTGQVFVGPNTGGSHGGKGGGGDA
ncbi:MAG: hypothetical protein ACJAR0_004852, partial [Candidatus Azotimanducaceae bacterium]